MNEPMGTTLDLFENDLGPCRHCGGQGQFVQYEAVPFLRRETEWFQKIVCITCTYETDGILIKDHSKIILQRVWDNGTPRLVLSSKRNNSVNMYMTIQEYHESWHDRWTLPRLRDGRPLYHFKTIVTRWTGLDARGKPVEDSMIDIANFRKLTIYSCFC